MTDTEIIPYLAEKLFGWEMFPLGRQGYSDCASPRLIQNIIGGWAFFPGAGSDNAVAFDPVNSISDAFQVVEKMREQGFWMRIESPFRIDAPFVAGTCRLDTSGWNGRMDNYIADFSCARAICLAAIAALEGKNA